MILSSFLSTCDTYEFPSSPYPSVETLPAINITSAGVTFQAEIIRLGDAPIIDHGFIWGFEENDFLNIEGKLQLGERTETGVFDAAVDFGLYPDTIYFMRAYVATSRYFVYGNVLSFTSKGSKPPEISSFTPNAGTWGDTVTIGGKFFSRSIISNKVSFGLVESEVIESTDSTIVCIVPDHVIQKSVPINITVTGNHALSQEEFVLLSPEIENFFPQVGTFEDIIVINGSNFNKVKERNLVKFNEHIAEILESSSSFLRVKVPTGITEKENTLSVKLNFQTDFSEELFQMIPPTINSLSTTEEFTGEIIEINGNYFNPLKEGNNVYFGERESQILSATKTTLLVEVPKGIHRRRSFPVEVKVAGQSSFSTEFTLLDPYIKKSDIPQGPFGRYSAVAFSINGKGYMGLGGGDVGNKFWQYDAFHNTWSEVAPFPGGERVEAVSFLVNNKAYVGLGSGQTDFYSYDPVQNSWERIADLPIADGYGYALAFSVNGLGYVMLDLETENFWEYNPLDNTWSLKSDLDFVGGEDFYRRPDAGFKIDNRFFVYVPDNTTIEDPLLEYDFTSDLWYSRAHIDDYIIQSNTVGFSLKGYGYIRGLNYLYRYNPLEDSWDSLDSDPLDQREGAFAFVIDGKVYIGGDLNYNRVDFWEYNPDFE